MFQITYLIFPEAWETCGTIRSLARHNSITLRVYPASIAFQAFIAVCFGFILHPLLSFTHLIGLEPSGHSSDLGIEVASAAGSACSCFS